jgi:hypothetical protein
MRIAIVATLGTYQADCAVAVRSGRCESPSFFRGPIGVGLVLDYPGTSGDQALQIRPQDLRALRLAADALDKMRRHAEALPLAQRAFALEHALDYHQPGHTTEGQAILWSVQSHLWIAVAPVPGGSVLPPVQLGPPVPRPASVTTSTVLLLVLACLYLTTIVLFAVGAANAEQLASPGEDPAAIATAIYVNMALLALFVPPIVVFALLNLGGRNGSRISTWVLCGLALPCSGWYVLAILAGSATSGSSRICHRPSAS